MARRLIAAALLAAAWITAFGTVAAAGPTVDAIKKRGQLSCGVGQGRAGFSATDSQGRWRGMDVDQCRALAAALLGDSEKVKWVVTTGVQRFALLQSGEIDVLSRNTTWTMSRDTTLGIDFVPVYFYSGTGLMVPKALNVKAAKELDGATICVAPGSTTEQDLSDFFRSSRIQFKPVVIENLKELLATYFAGRCDAIAQDRSGLVSIRAYDAASPDDHVVLPDLLSKEPLAMAVRHGDDHFRDVVTWTVYAMMEAEELGVAAANADAMLKSESLAVQRLLGVTGNLGSKMGLDDQWAYRLIKQVGNYAEMYERNVGKDSPLKLERGLNRLWRDGGILYPIPFK